MPALAEVTRKLKEVFPEKQAQVLVELVELANQLVKASDFLELKQVVQELAEAQKRTEKRVEELAEAQKRTEKRVEELAEAQKRSEARITRLEATVQELAEAQKRTEKRVEELAEAQKRTERRLEELAEAQKRTEDALQKLAEEHLETRRQLGGLAMTVGYTLENEAYRALPPLLQQDYGLVVEGRLKRAHVSLGDGGYLEVNILGDGTLEGRRVKIVGESKAQLSQNDIDRFIRRKLNRLQQVFPEVFPVLVTHMVTSPGVEEYARSKGIALYYSYDF